MDIKETREEILNRAKKYHIKKERRRMRILKSSAALIVLFIVGTFYHVSNVGVFGTDSGNYGAMAIGSEAGGYIIIGILCFLLGVILTMIAVKRRGAEKEE